MKLDYVITAVNENKTYLDFLPIFVKTWNKLYPNVIVKVVLIAQKIPNELLAYKDSILLFEPIKNVSTAFTSQIIRILYPSIINCKNGVLITDIDMLPMNNSYYTKNIASIGNNKFVQYRGNILSDKKQIPICYNIATPETWSDIFGVSSLRDIRSFIKKVSDDNIIVEGRGKKGWFLDQLTLHHKVIKWDAKTNNYVRLNESQTGFERLCRSQNFDLKSRRKDIVAGKYTDYHCYAPMSKYGEINWNIYELL